MLNLLIKDLMLLKKHIWLLAVYSIMVFFLFSRTDMASQTVYVMGITMISYLLVMYCTAYDDMNKSDVFLNSMPIKRRDIVAERYLSLLVFLIAASLAMTASGAVVTGMGLVENARLINLSDIATASFSIGLLAFIYFPVYFKLGYVKAKLFNFAIFFAVFFVPTFLAKLLFKGDAPKWIKSLDSVSEISIIFALLAFTALAGTVSFCFSNHFYKKREF